MSEYLPVHVQIRASLSGDWDLVPDTQVRESPHGRTVSIPLDSTYGARITAGTVGKWFVVMNSDDSPTRTNPQWRGIVRSWRPAADRVELDVRPASILEHTYG